MKYNIYIRFEDKGSIDLDIIGDFKAIREALNLLMDSPILHGICISKIKSEKQEE